MTGHVIAMMVISVQDVINVLKDTIQVGPTHFNAVVRIGISIFYISINWLGTDVYRFDLFILFQ